MSEADNSVAKAVEAAVAREPDRSALVFLGQRYSYRRLWRDASALAGAMAARGIAPGDRVMIYAPHCPQWVIAWLAAQRLGAVAVPVTHFYGAEDLRAIACDSGAVAILCADTGFGQLDRVLSRTPLRLVMVTSLVDLLPAWKRLLGHALDRVPTGRTRAGKGIVPLRRLLAEGAAPPEPAPAAGALCEMLFTGGTTGRPKGVPISHGLWLTACREQRRASLAAVPEGAQVVLQGAALYHILGQVVGLGALLFGETVLLLPRGNLDALLDHVARYRATTLIGTPTFFRSLLEHDRISQYELSSLRFCFSGGDVLPAETAARWQRLTGRPLLQGYGATETCGGVALCAADDSAPPGAAGRICAHQRVRVVDPETLAPLPPGEGGELLVSSDQMVREYWNQPEETAKAFIELEGRRWYRTGDVVRINADGWMFFLDRSVDLIKHKGWRVAASRVDRALQEHPAVIASCTVGVPDPEAGERIKSFVVARSDVAGVNAAELIRWCKDRLAPYEVPQYVEFRDMLPKSKVGKTLRRELRDEERRKRG